MNDEPHTEVEASEVMRSDHGPTVAFGDTSDPRVREAASRLLLAGVVTPLFVCGPGDPEPPTGIEGHRIAAGLDPLTELARIVSESSVAAGVAGSLSSSPSVIRAGIKGLPRRGLVTGCFVMKSEGAVTTFADCSVVPDPTDDQLADIAIAAADHHGACTGEEPRIGMLSFSTAGSANHPAVDKVRRATTMVRARRPDLVVEGEMQFDAAVDLEIGLRKFPDSIVAGRVNVMVFPTLDAGNIAYKVAERLGGARALGSFVLNLEKPWVDLSRGCTTDDVVDTVRLVAALHSNVGSLPVHHDKEHATP